MTASKLRRATFGSRKTLRFHYVGIRVTDLERSLRFYTEALGLKETVRGDHRKIGRGIWVGLTDPVSGRMLELNWYPPRSRFATRYVPGDGLDHLGFFLGRVPPKALDAAYRRLLAAGARPTDITPQNTSGWQACVLDPDGNWIELFRWPARRRRRGGKGNRL